jgi:hypothetical protein
MTRKWISLISLCAGIFYCMNGYSQQWGLYTLYATKNGTQTYLIDTANSPSTYHTWTSLSTKKTAYSTYLIIPGDTLVRTYKPSGNTTWNTGPCHGGIQKVLWDGTVVWDWTYYQANSYCPHHDICPMPNGNVLMICYEVKSVAEATQAGASSSVQIYAEKIIEVHPTGATTATIVWEWHLWNHLCQNYNAAKDNYVSDGIVNHPGLLNINYVNPSNPDLSDRWHMNGIDYNATLDQIVVSMHFMNSAFVIDHSTTIAEAATHSGGNSGKGGDFLYRWGNPASYEATGTTIFNVIHDAHWVPSNNPNYPDYLCGFNNNNISNPATQFSKVDIWSPPYSGYNYSLTLGQAYAPASYNYEFTTVFKSTNEGNSQQLPNGNMIVNNSFGNIYEVNAAGTQLWTKSGANSTHAYRFTLCDIRGPIATAGASSTSVTSGTPVTLNSSATSVTETSPAYSYSWSSSPTGFTSSSQNPSATPTTTTTYTVTITNTGLGCSSSASITINVTVGVDNNADGNKLTIYPNPTTGIVNINENYTNEDYQVYLCNSFGEVVMMENNAKTIDLSDFPAGIYYLKIRGEKVDFIKKIILIQ